MAADTSRAERFADALTRLEQSRDTATMAEQFGDDPELRRPETDTATGDVDGFWSKYLDQFDEIGTEFTHVAEAEDLAVLEWTSKGRLAAGRDIEYRGVSLLSFVGDRVRRFSTYYDTAAFVVPDAS
jgi:ketosteroid isomerase-like protein